VNFFSINDQKD